MPLYLLDTNIISDAIRNTRGLSAQRIRKEHPDNLCTSIIVAAELRFGAKKKESSELSHRIDQVLVSLSIRPLADNADQLYGELRFDLERRGQVIGANDMLIGAHALAINAVLVTDNIKEFSRVKKLKIENWLIRD